MNNIDPTASSELLAFLIDVARHGITLQAHNGKLRFRPSSAVTPSLAEGLLAHKPALLTLLVRSAADKTESSEEMEADDQTLSGVLSVLSVSEEEPAGADLWGEDELAILARAGTSPAELTLLTAVKSAFADLGATVVSAETEYGRGGWTRRRAAELIRRARRHSPTEAAVMRSAWAERMGVCTSEGGLTEDQAERIALAELEERGLLLE